MNPVESADVVGSPGPLIRLETSLYTPGGPDGLFTSSLGSVCAGERSSGSVALNCKSG